MTRSEKVKKNREDRKIGGIYIRYLNGMGVSVLKIPEIYAIARTMLQRGETDDAIGAAMVAMVKE
jgi:hypothetical protein